MQICLSISIPDRAYSATFNVKNEDIIIMINIDHFSNTVSLLPKIFQKSILRFNDR